MTPRPPGRRSMPPSPSQIPMPCGSASDSVPSWGSRLQPRPGTRTSLRGAGSWSPLPRTGRRSWSSRTCTGLLISYLLEQAELPVDVRATILERSGGNPLYAEEFVRLLKDREILKERGAGWRLDPSSEIPIPTSIQGLIAARLDTLDATR